MRGARPQDGGGSGDRHRCLHRRGRWIAGGVVPGTSGKLLLGFYGSGVTIAYERGEVVAVEAAGPEQGPTSKGGAGVPPDLVATLIFGRYGASGLAARHDDVDLGGAAGLMDALFPPLRADMLLD